MMLKDYVKIGVLEKMGYFKKPCYNGGITDPEGGFSWYLGYFNGTSIIILRDTKLKKEGDEQTWYFRSFREKPPIKSLAGSGGIERFYTRLRETYTDNHKIAPENLEKAILDALAA